MPTFLSDLSIYNAKASAAITQAGLDGDTGKANLMSSLKTTANDVTLSQELRLNALTALINVGNLLDIPLPPYFPIAVTYANTVTYVGLHDNLSGLQGGGPGEYYHLTSAERNDILSKVSPNQLRFANLIDSPLDNAQLDSILLGKQNALSGTGFVKINGTTISYDNSTYLTSVSGAAGGDLSGTYPNPTISSSVVMGKTMAGWNSSYPSGTGAISSADTLLVAIQKLNVSLNGIIANPSGVSSVALNLLPTTIFDSTTTPASGAVVLGGSFKSQSANTFLAAPNGTPGTPTFRAMVPDDVPNLGVSPAGTYGGGDPLQIPVITVDAKGRVTTVSLAAATGSGTVTSVGIDPPNYIAAGSAITTSGNISLAWENTITPNYVLAGPSSGSSTAAPTFRSLVALDIPNIAISQVSSLQSQLDSKMTYSLNDGEIFIGSIANAPAMKSLTGDITMTREGVVTIAGESVTFSKMQEITSGTLLGRWGAADPGPIQEVGLSGDFVLDSGTGILSLAVPVAPILDTKGGLITYRQSIGQQVQLTAVFDGNLLITDSAEDDGLKWVTAQGDIEVDGALDGTFNITPGAITLAKMANLAANSFIGNNTGSSATPIALTVTQATAMLNQFTTSAKGLVPAASFTPTSGKTLADYFLNASGGWSLGGGGGGGSGTVTSVSVVSANGFAGTVAYSTTTPAITLTTSITGLLKGNGTAISAATSGTDYAPATSGTSILKGNGSGGFSNATSGTDYAPATSGTSILYGNGSGGFSNVSIGTGLSFSGGTLSNTGVTSVGMTVPSAFNVSPSTITTTGTFAITGAGATTQYVRGDGTLGVFPAIGGGGGGTVYYFNGGISQGSIGGTTMYQLSKAANTGTAADFTGNTNGATLASFITDSGDPNQTSIPAGRWVFEAYLSAAGGGSANATVQAVVETWNGTTITVIATGPSEEITNGTAKDLYTFAVTIPTGTTILATDRIVVQIKIVAAASKTITLYTQDGNVSGVTTTFPNGIVSLNSLTAGTQIFANGSTGTAPAFVSSTATHTLNIPFASASSVTAGLISKTEYDTFNGKLSNVLTTTGDIIYSSSGTTAQRLPIGSSGQVLTVSGGIPAWGTAGAGNVVGPGSSTTGNFAVYADTTGTLLANPSVATLSATGRATFNDGVDLGVSSSATGTLVFRNGTTAATTTFQSSTSQSANLNYTWPISAPTVGQILSSDASGNMSWTAAGAGDMTLAGVQTVTGAKTFGAAGNVGKLILAGSTSGTTILNAAAVAGSTTVTLPASTSTLAALGLAQTFSALQTYSAGIALTTSGTFTTAAAVSSTFTGSVTMNFAGSATSSQLTLTGGTANWINLSGATGAPVTGATRSVGTKFVLFANAGVNNIDYALGISGTGEIWETVPTTGTYGWYHGGTSLVKTLALTSTSLTFADAVNLIFNTTTGTKIGTATGQKIAFWNKTPIIQPTTAITGATRVGGAGTTVTTTDTYGGYTIAQIAAALVNTGILA